jgi:cysteine-rich repeat protein
MNQVICNFCDFTKNYVIDANNKCVCEKGFKNVNSVCEDICGDGLILKSECDDNNTFDGDGCSSSCRIEKDFICFKIKSGISKCKLDKNIKFKLEYVNKVMNENKALIYIKLDTDNLNVRRFYESALFNLTLSSNRTNTI